VNHRLGALCLAALAAMGLVACSTDGSSGGDAPSAPSIAATLPVTTTTGLSGDVTVVRIGTEEHDDGPTAELLTEFAAAVSRASGGRVVVEPSYSVIGSLGGGVAWDQRAIGLAADGTYDGAVARAGAWHQTGVTTLDVLQLPGLVDTSVQAASLVGDEDAVSQLLAGLASAGFTGLGLYPEGPRYLMLLDDTTDFSLAALAGRTVRAPLSETVFDVLTSLGMRPVDLTAADFTVQVPEGTVTATEGHLARVAVTTTADGDSDAAVAVDVPLYTKFLVLAVRSDALAPGVLDILQQAARDVVPAFLATRPTEAQAAREACAAGGVLVDVPDADAAELRDAIAPVADRFAEGPDGALIEVVAGAAGKAEPHSLSCAS
jgi:TRAP-type transport system periplasmic protein